MAIDPICRTPSLPEFFGKCLPRPYDYLEEGGKVLASLEVFSKGGEANESGKINTGVNPALINTRFWTPTRKTYAFVGVAAAVSLAGYWFYKQSQSNYAQKVQNVNLSKPNSYIEAAKKGFAVKKELKRQEGDP